jgi:hypothetical protein
MLTELGKSRAKFEYLATQLGIANTHLHFFRQLSAAKQDTRKKQFYKSLDFWGYTISAHIQATVVHLCRVYDPCLDRRDKRNQRDEETFHLLRFLEEIDQSKLNASEQALRLSDLEFVQREDAKTSKRPHPSIAKLRIWRNKLVAHRARDLAIEGTYSFLQRYPSNLEEIQFLIDHAFEILDHWKRYYHCDGEIKRLAGGHEGYKLVLDALRLLPLHRLNAEPPARNQ